MMLRYASASTIIALQLLLLSCAQSKQDAPVTPAATGITQNLAKAETAVPFSYIDRVGATENPFVKGSAVIGRSEQVTLLGWAIDPETKSPAASVDIAIDNVPYAARYGSERPDVADALKAPDCRRSGVEFSMPAAMLPAGEHRLAMRVVPKGKNLYYEGPVLVMHVK